jgi:two-component system sensor histidine kinase UhpB
LQTGLSKLEYGDFDAVVPPFSIPELAPIGETFNHLASTMRQTQEKNDLLIGKLISLQETERRELAHELHDELGPCLFGIKSEAACIGHVAATVTEEETRTRTAIIVKLVDDLQNMNRRILARLRPIALAELGLLPALERLIEDWRERAPDIQWSFHCGRFSHEPPPDQALALYRAVQECLTNAARHSGASSVSVELACDEHTRMLIVDDGRGIGSDVKHGFGLLGMRERVFAVGGDIEISNNSDGGAKIEIWI